MAREESDREDLLREATALVERIELSPIDDRAGEHIFVGFRTGGAASFFFGAEPVYHFNSRRELRRAFHGGLLYKSEQGRLIELERVRLADSIELRRRKLADAEQSQFLQEAQSQLEQIRDQIATCKLTIVGQVPATADVLGRVREWLADMGSIAVARSPHAR
jgi:hypothetical protein